MRRKANLTVQPPAEGKHIAYDRDLKEWLGFFNGQPVLESADTNVEQTRAKLDAHVYDVLKAKYTQAA